MRKMPSGSNVTKNNVGENVDFDRLELFPDELDMFHNVGWHLVRFVNNRPLKTWPLDDVPASNDAQVLADSRCKEALKFVSEGPEVWLCMYSGGRLFEPLHVGLDAQGIARLARFIGELSVRDAQEGF